MLNRLTMMKLTTATALATVTALATMAGLTVLPMQASAKQARPAAPTEETAPREAGEPVMAIVSIKAQKVTFYDNDGWILRAPVSTGIGGRETPAGVFAVIEKDKDHHSSLYDDAWMPNMQRITWNGVALHGGPLPGYAASHGCVRMPYGFAEKLFERTRIGMRVIIAPNDPVPVDFSDPKLFVPKPDAIAAAPARIETASHEAEEARKAADDAKKIAASAARDGAALTASLRNLERAKTRADAELALADKMVASAKTEKAIARAAQLKATAEPKAADASARLDAAKEASKSKPDVAAAKEAAKAAEAKKVATAKAATDAKLAQEPVSVYISRATQKLYVRRNTHKPWADGGEVFDFSIEVPVTIRDPERPIGTHIFTALAGPDKSLRWNVVSIDEGDDAKDALDRVTIPQEIVDRIGSTALPRSSIIISDEPLSSETNYRTEFVAVLNNQPQGGFITRKPTPKPEMMMASDDDGFGFFRRAFSPQPEPPPEYMRQRGRPLYREVRPPVRQGWGW